MESTMALIRDLILALIQEQALFSRLDWVGVLLPGPISILEQQQPHRVRLLLAAGKCPQEFILQIWFH